jgi:hypothetical protein
MVVNPFWRNTKTEKHRPDSDILDPPKGERRDPGDDDDLPRRGKTIKCEFCECRLSHNGERISLSDRARHLRTLDEEDKKQTSEITRLAEENADLKKRIEDLQKKPSEPRRYPWKS